MPMIKFSDCETTRKMYYPMPSNDFIKVKKSGTQAGIEPTAFGNKKNSPRGSWTLNWQKIYKTMSEILAKSVTRGRCLAALAKLTFR